MDDGPTFLKTYPWGEDAFKKARREDKPILVSIGYSCNSGRVYLLFAFGFPKVFYVGKTGPNVQRLSMNIILCSQNRRD